MNLAAQIEADPEAWRDTVEFLTDFLAAEDVDVLVAALLGSQSPSAWELCRALSSGAEATAVPSSAFEVPEAAFEKEAYELSPKPVPSTIGHRAATARKCLSRKGRAIAGVVVLTLVVAAILNWALTRALVFGLAGPRGFPLHSLLLLIGLVTLLLITILSLRGRRSNKTARPARGVTGRITKRFGAPPSYTPSRDPSTGVADLQHYPLSSHTAFGSNPTICDVVIWNDPYVSGRHFTVSREADAFCIEDKGSANGTRVNGWLIPSGKKIRLSDGDVIHVGMTDLMFRVLGGEAEILAPGPQQQAAMKAGTAWLRSTTERLGVISRRLSRAKLRRALALSNHDLDGSLLAFNEVIAVDPLRPEGYVARAQVYTEMGREQEALGDLTIALDLEPDRALVVYRRGKSYARIGLLQEALADLNRALELNPRAMEALVERGLVQESLGQWESAEDSLSEALETSSPDPQVMVARGRVRLQLGHLDKALADLSAALDLDPEHQEALELRAGLLARLQREDEARTDRERLAAIRRLLQRAHQDRVQRFELARMERLKDLPPAAVVAMADAERGRIIADMQRTEAMKGLTEQQILAVAAENSPEAAAALAEIAKAMVEGRLTQEQVVIYERLLEQNQELLAEKGRSTDQVSRPSRGSAGRAQDAANQAIDVER